MIVNSWLYAEYVRNDTDQTVYDTKTGLTWQDDNIVKTTRRSWQEAIEYCEALNFAGKQDWRLPNFFELFMIADRSRYDPAIDPAFKSVATSSGCWSSTTGALGTSARLVYFYDGQDYWLNKTDTDYVRCVRGGQ